MVVRNNQRKLSGQRPSPSPFFQEFSRYGGWRTIIVTYVSQTDANLFLPQWVEAIVVHKIFISHTWRASNTYYRGLLRLLDEADKADIVDLSVLNRNRIDGDNIRRRGWVLRFLKAADTVLVVNTLDITNPLVQSELRLAERHEIPIVAIDPPKRHGAPGRSEIAAIAGAYSARWTSHNIVDAIRTAVSAKSRASKAREPLMHYAFQSVAVAAAGERLTPVELEAVRGDDEVPILATSSAAKARGQLPLNALSRLRENSITRKTALLPLLVRTSLLSRSRQVRN
jgi:hypothetical protein